MTYADFIDWLNDHIDLFSDATSIEELVELILELQGTSQSLVNADDIQSFIPDFFDDIQELQHEEEITGEVSQAEEIQEFIADTVEDIERTVTERIVAESRKAYQPVIDSLRNIGSAIKGFFRFGRR